jgi:hypothetical protein
MVFRLDIHHARCLWLSESNHARCCAAMMDVRPGHPAGGSMLNPMRITAVSPVAVAASVSNVGRSPDWRIIAALTPSRVQTQ